MADVNCTERMDAVLKAIEEWGEQIGHTDFAVDTRKECVGDWTKDYAIIEFDFDYVGGESFVDVGAARDSVDAAIRKAAGEGFIIAYGHVKGALEKRKPGEVYLHFHAREVEMYRVKANG